ncbi:hypothetical protein NUU61_001570 [Penicillium alfredii]|uniref:Uncharacterized protein n=1 Tax=Penicillium alfredii TaxID=1506179 RepID=A0A9W9KN64_9EURO|nr:uncharacterized protein NUU61_001303 [Penicillium alfredii]XP_056515213.1 uncharacterized protein NUU61_001364 [Penicillium alfredii]XP_056515419.1 uncharacterized protein NUU61_001570 [Penicillium alfredii]KAJ5111673.1 hypothetical protein NUU61_001303 [Penicillium alfredii]KAJ5111734.1 hypothetical protein NUU61_001364 [Penicillium alfredii]KAJ5111940.1 hypothetical protein NUU61_001570 [Penicillium alfredii]
MAKVKKNLNFQRYLDLKKEDLDLPSLEEDTKGYYTVEVGERYCRVEDCVNDTLFTSTNNLRKHILKQHPEVLLTGEESGGRPTQTEEARAIKFYNDIMKAYDDREAEKEEVLPDLPLKNDGSVNITKMRRAIRAMKLPVPCEVCKDNDQPKLCCHDDVKDTCEHFDMFVDPRDQEDDGDEA